MDQELYLDLLKRIIAAEKKIEELEAEVARLKDAPDSSQMTAQQPKERKAPPQLTTRAKAMAFVERRLATELPGYHTLGSGHQGKNRLRLINAEGEYKNLHLTSSRNHASSSKASFESWNTVAQDALDSAELFILCAEGRDDAVYPFIFTQSELKTLCASKMPDHEGKFRFRLFVDEYGTYWDENPQDNPAPNIDVTRYYENWSVLRF